MIYVGKQALFSIQSWWKYLLINNAQYTAKYIQYIQ